MMRKSDPQLQEDGFNWLLPRSSEFIEELIIEFNSEKNLGLSCWLLELIGESKSLKSFETLQKSLVNENESIREWAIIGLRNLDTKESRHLLFDLKL